MTVFRTTILAAITGLAALCLIVFLGRGDVRAEEDTGDGPAAGEGLPFDEAGNAVPQADERNFFQLYPADDGAQQYEDLNELEKAAVDRAGEWAETSLGHSTQQAWSARAASVRARARLVIAQRNSGLEGSEDTGVE